MPVSGVVEVSGLSVAYGLARGTRRRIKTRAGREAASTRPAGHTLRSLVSR